LAVSSTPEISAVAPRFLDYVGVYGSEIWSSRTKSRRLLDLIPYLKVRLLILFRGFVLLGFYYDYERMGLNLSSGQSCYFVVVDV
jgi:hypothetical protein